MAASTSRLGQTQPNPGKRLGERNLGAVDGKYLLQKLKDLARVPSRVGIQEGGYNPAQKERHDQTLIDPGHEGPQQQEDREKAKGTHTG